MCSIWDRMCSVWFVVATGLCARPGWTLSYPTPPRRMLLVDDIICNLYLSALSLARPAVMSAAACARVSASYSLICIQPWCSMTPLALCPGLSLVSTWGAIHNSQELLCR